MVEMCFYGYLSKQQRVPFLCPLSVKSDQLPQLLTGLDALDICCHDGQIHRVFCSQNIQSQDSNWLD